MPEVISKAAIASARKALSLLDPALAEADKVTPSFAWWTKPKGFTGLISLIVEQQVSIASAKAVFKRLTEGLGGITAERILARDIDQLKSFGLSTPKARYIHGVAQAHASGAINLQELSKLDDDAASEKLIALKGIGRWTAEAYLMGCEGRLDVFPAGDIALQEAIRILDKKAVRPSLDEFYARSEKWRPYRSIAANLLWGYYLCIKSNVIPMPQGVPPMIKAIKPALKKGTARKSRTSRSKKQIAQRAARKPGRQDAQKG